MRRIDHQILLPALRDDARHLQHSTPRLTHTLIAESARLRHILRVPSANLIKRNRLKGAWPTIAYPQPIGCPILRFFLAKELQGTRYVFTVA
jgi:hypothetical protein